MNKLMMIGLAGLVLCAVLTGCAGTSVRAIAPDGAGIFNSQLLARDADDLAFAVGAKELVRNPSPEKRARVEKLAGELELLARNETASDALLWALLEPAIYRVEDPNAQLKIVAGRILLRRAVPGGAVWTTVNAPEQVRAVAEGTAKGLRRSLAAIKR